MSTLRQPSENHSQRNKMGRRSMLHVTLACPLLPSWHSNIDQFQKRRVARQNRHRNKHHDTRTAFPQKKGNDSTKKETDTQKSSGYTQIKKRLPPNSNDFIPYDPLRYLGRVRQAYRCVHHGYPHDYHQDYPHGCGYCEQTLLARERSAQRRWPRQVASGTEIDRSKPR